MSRIAFSDVGLRSLPVPQTGQVSYWDDKLPKFGIRISRGGSRTFVVKHQNRFHTLGRFPVLSLSDARTEAKRLLAEFTLRRIRPQSITYESAVEVYLEEKTKERRPRTVRDYGRLLKRLNFKGQLSEITHEETQRKLRRFTARGEYNHLLVAARVFFNWCIKRRYIEHNPTLGLSQHKAMPRSRVLSDEELGNIWKFAAEHPTTHFGRFVQLLILTGLRRGECAALRNEWLQHDRIELPASATKNGRAFSLPIGSLAISLLSSLATTTSPLIFPAHGATDVPFSGFSKSKKALDKLSGVTGWTLHDLRRTYATKMAALGCPPYIIEALLNHASGQISGVAAVYNRHKYIEEARPWVERYERHIQEIIPR